ncbi:hypothetical protein Hanom_Chr10g00907541 [Helianthus anomalus]
MKAKFSLKVLKISLTGQNKHASENGFNLYNKPMIRTQYGISQLLMKCMKYRNQINTFI